MLCKKHNVTYFLVCKRLSNAGVGVARGTVLKKTRSGVGSETGDFDREKLGGATVERLTTQAGPTQKQLRFQLFCYFVLCGDQDVAGKTPDDERIKLGKTYQTINRRADGLLITQTVVGQVRG